MEINDYVRTKDGIIGKYIQPELGKPYITNGISFNEGANYGKHSEDIIDLVKAGDIVTICNNFGGHKLETYMVDNNSKENCLDVLKSIIDKSGYSIEKILTHEQFEANAYTIEKER